MAARRHLPRRVAKLIAVDLALMLLLNTYFATVLWLAALRQDPEVAWLDQFTFYLPTWCVLALMAPVLFELTKRQRIGLGRGLRPLLVHLAMSLVWLLLVSTAWVLADWLRHPERMTTVADVVSSRLITAMLDYQWYWLVLAAAHGYHGTRDAIARAGETAGWQRDKAQLERRLAHAELDALKAQLHPHFLFNTHHAIAGLIRSQQPRAALELLSNLSAMLRYALETDAHATVALARELDFVRQFLAIQALRFSDRLAVEWEVEDACGQVPVPPLILQPLIENAVHHGVSADREHNFVRVRGRIVGELLELEIRNSMVEDNDDRTGFGIGLKNVHGRLQHLYGDGYTLELELIARAEMRLLMTLPAHQKGGLSATDPNLAR